MRKTKEINIGGNLFIITQLGGEDSMDLFPTVQMSLLPIVAGMADNSGDALLTGMQGIKEYPRIARTLEESIAVRIDPEGKGKNSPPVAVKLVANDIFAGRQMDRLKLCKEAVVFNYADFFDWFLPELNKAIAKFLSGILVSTIQKTGMSDGGPGESSSTHKSEEGPASTTSSETGP